MLRQAQSPGCIKASGLDALCQKLELPATRGEDKSLFGEEFGRHEIQTFAVWLSPPKQKELN